MYPKRNTAKAAKVCILLVFTIGLLHLLADLKLIPKILSQLPQMSFVTAVLLIISSFSLWLYDKKDKTGSTALRVTALIILLGCIFTLMIGKNSSFSQDRMSLIATFVFFNLAVIFVLLSNNSRHQDHLAHTLLIPAAAVSYFALFSYVLNVYELFKTGEITIAPGAALGLFITCLAILFLKNNTWLMRVLAGPGLGSMTGRRWLPWILAVPVIVVILRLKAERNGLIISEALVMIVFVFYTTFLVSLLIVNARWLNRIDESRQKAEEALQKSEQGLAALLKASSNAIYRMSPDWKILYKVSGQLFKPAENKPYDPGEYIPEEDLPEVEKSINQAVKNKKMFELEHRIYLSDGTVGWSHSRAVPILNKDGDLVEWFGYAIDITDRKSAEEALLESQQRYAALFANKLIAIAHCRIVTDEEGNAKDLLYLQVNNGYELLFGIKKAAIEGRTMMEVYEELPEDYYKNIEKYFRVATQGTEERFETYFKPRDQHLSIYVYSPKNGEVIGLLTDISEKVKAEKMIQNYNKDLEDKVKKRTDQLEKARERAESADKLKTSFLLNMSHELRTPLNSIIGFSGILLKRLAGPLNTEQEKQLEMVQKSGRHLLSLINDILDISKIDAGELKPEYESFDLKEIIEEVMKLVQPFADSREISLRFEKDQNIGQIRSDKKRVRQIFINLINNGIKFTEKGSVTITCCREGNWVITDISDTGIGIREEDIKNLFNPFIQLENNLTRKFEGSGLGLSITKKLLEMLHGSINVKSEPGAGSTFTIKIPDERESL